MTDPHDDSEASALPPALTHLDEEGRMRMVDVGHKPASDRSATASARVRMQPATLALVLDGKLPKGDVSAVARVAGIMASKRTPELIPLCHQVAMTSCEVSITPGSDGSSIGIVATARARDRTGVEMEAMTAAAIAALAVYDMIKGVDRGALIESVALESKTGGVRGPYARR